MRNSNEVEMTLLDDTLKKIVPIDSIIRNEAVNYINRLTMPQWALGRVLDLAVELAGIYRKVHFSTARKKIILMAGDHGVVAEGVACQPQSVTAQMVENFVHGGAAINALAGAAGAELLVADIGVAADISHLYPAVINRKIAYGTRNMAQMPAMTEEEARRAVETGIEIVYANDESTDLFAVGEMGIGNTTCSSAVLAVIAGIEPQLAVGRGAGLNPGLLGHKAQVIARAIDKHKPDKDNPIEVLAKVGGFELGGIAGVILGAAACRKPVVIDGFISTAAALIAAKLAPESVDYMIMAHASAEPGHSAMLDFLGKKPLLDLDMRLGEGSGAAVAMPILDSAAAIINNMATFEQAKVTDEGVR